MRIGPLCWHGQVFIFSLPRVPAVQCGAGWQAQGKGPICCMRLFQSRYSTGCHLFGETQGEARLWGGGYVHVGVGYGGKFSQNNMCSLILKTNHVCVFNSNSICLTLHLPTHKCVYRQRKCTPRIVCLLFHIFGIIFCSSVYFVCSVFKE